MIPKNMKGAEMISEPFFIYIAVCRGRSGAMLEMPSASPTA